MNERTRSKLETRIKETVAAVIVRDLVDPRLGLVTVTAVSLSPELDVATVYVSILGTDADVKKSMTALSGASGYLQEALGRVLETRRTPRLRFVYDDSIAEADRLAALIRDARREDDAAAVARGESIGGDTEGGEEGSEEGSEETPDGAERPAAP